MTVIQAKDVTKDFGPMRALDEVSLDVRKGDFFGFFGPNGAGKTTLLRILTGQIQPSSGSVTVLGTDVTDKPIAVKELVGIVPEVESPPTYLTGAEYLYFVGKVR
ncbi:MAG: ATP-binding cassette domain-containing protein, partial [Methanobacteriota archaeon]